ncbi:phosphoenolpyruvate carboxykinase (ATP) [Reichenbachiella agariperforans]|uniref:phosphoenolpyruvate carboxykinase (ATP) n=1 Tax=Reichenbachiella agariperforans TaxID=156994 RepID=UPI001C0A4000|nr:phosphoenolpyruvate carboxykinase (ATP) [Reichenbachiella agariperforans]MBU2912961.1 phosphoenolpyruvate carboxykinase (ATP) [Reichenbachiella agariperforans]
MKNTNLKSLMEDMIELGLEHVKGVLWNLTPAELITEAVKKDEGVLTDTGALMCRTGKFTGRSPKDRYIVKDAITKDKVWWGDINISFDEDKFDALYNKMVASLGDKILYVRDAYAGADPQHRLKVRVIDTQAWHNLFCYNMFIQPENDDLTDFHPEFTVLAVPEFYADPEVDGTRQKNFAIVNFTKKVIMVGGTGYTGETKKGIFSVLNFLLPEKDHVLSMHCSANIGKERGDSAVFFGLSGTGKTTLSADPNRLLIGDDEHGWTDEGIFNFEGGCYAKTIDLTQEKEPEIWDAIKFGAILENTKFYPGTNTVNYADCSITENTRVSYPLKNVKNAVTPSVGGIPENIFFLTCDASGVLPPISKLTVGQAMYHFISGFTAKVAGTEAGITEPVSVFSACFGAPFMPLHPTKYAELLGEKIKTHDVNIWLINTGWSGGEYGVGQRIKLKYTRAMISAALEGKLDDVNYSQHPVFGLAMPDAVAGVPAEILNPRNTWADQAAYDRKADKLASQFVANFVKFEEYANDEIMSGAPVVEDSVLA